MKPRLLAALLTGVLLAGCTTPPAPQPESTPGPISTTPTPTPTPSRTAVPGESVDADILVDNILVATNAVSTFHQTAHLTVGRDRLRFGLDTTLTIDRRVPSEIRASGQVATQGQRIEIITVGDTAYGRPVGGNKYREIPMDTRVAGDARPFKSLQSIRALVLAATFVGEETVAAQPTRHYALEFPEDALGVIASMTSWEGSAKDATYTMDIWLDAQNRAVKASMDVTSPFVTLQDVEELTELDEPVSIEAPAEGDIEG